MASTALLHVAVAAYLWLCMLISPCAYTCVVVLISGVLVLAWKKKMEPPWPIHGNHPTYGTTPYHGSCGVRGCAAGALGPEEADRLRTFRIRKGAGRGVGAEAV